VRRAGAAAAALAAVALTGCSGSGGKKPQRAVAPARTVQVTDRPPPVRRPVTRRTLVAALGDSITEGAPYWSNDPAVRRAYADQINPQSQYEYWARRRLGPLVRFRNCGVSGEETSQIAARFDACTRSANTLIVQGGINDIAHDKPPEEAAAQLRAMVARGKARGLRTAIAEVLPWTNGHPRYDGAVRRLNALIAGIGRAERVPVIRWYRVLLDPRRPGRMRPALTAEGDHPTVLGYKLLGEAVELPRN
jgi:lysophospholipase L1-like esterase